MDYKEEFIKMLGEIYLENYDDQIDGSYQLNDPKVMQFLEIYNYCKMLAEQNGTRIERVITKKKSQPAEIEIRFTDDLVFDSNENTLCDFIDALKKCDGVNINGTGLEDGSFCISFFVTDFYIKK